MRPSRRLGYRFDVAFDAGPRKLNLAVENHGRLGVHLQARSLTVAGAPYSYTVGAGDELDLGAPNPGTYDLSLHGPTASSATSPALPPRRCASRSSSNHRLGQAEAPAHRRRRPGGGHRRRPVVVHGRQRLRARPEASSCTAPRRSRSTPSHSGGWYDIALTTPSDTSFSYSSPGASSRAPG